MSKMTKRLCQVNNGCCCSINYSLVTFTLITFVCYTVGQTFPEVGSSCIRSGKGSIQSKGTCTPLSNCQSAISDLKAGLNPTVCEIKNRVAVVCCWNETRISATKCLQYQELLKEIDGTPVPLLPFEFLDDQDTEKRTVQCGNMLNGLIVGGRDAKVDEFPFAVALGFGTDDKPLIWGCGGTLISEEFVLTAAHCLTAALGKPRKVLLGDITLSQKTGSGRRLVGISEYFMHPDYKQPSSYNDIALLRLDRRVNISRSILPACLPEPEFRLDKKNQVTATGWGRLAYAESQSENLQAVNLTRFNSTSCNEFYDDLPAKKLKYPEGILRKQICAGDRESSKDSCQGDSGGPLTTNLNHRCVHYVIGITSFGSNFCGLAGPGVYTNVQSYLDWIEDVVWLRRKELT